MIWNRADTEEQLSTSRRSGKPKLKILQQRQVLVRMSLIFLFLGALAVRIPYLESSSMLSEVQFRSALIARGYYFELIDTVPDWRRQINVHSVQNLSGKEPPIMQLMVSFLYWIVSGESLGVARLLAATYWIVGGIFLFSISQRITSSEEAAVFATAYYLFVPIGVKISVSFLIDPFMIMLFLLSLFSIVNYYDKPSKVKLVIAAIVSGVAIFIKPLCLFTILCAFGALMSYSQSSWRRIISLDLLIFLGICFLPVFYYLYSIFITNSLTSQAEVSFLPELLLTRHYWRGWLMTAIGAVGYAPLIAAFSGLPLVRQGLSRTLLVGLWIGYIIYGLIFTFHIRFAEHYHLQLIIIVALSFAPIIALIANYLKQVSDGWYGWLPIIGALLLTILFSIVVIRDTMASQDITEDEKTAQEIGEIVQHSNKVVYIASYYGRPLEYLGELSGSYWPRKISDTDRILRYEHPRSVKERLDTLDFFPEYFVITDFKEFNRHHADLKKYLINHCSLLVENDKYIIYSVCRG